MTARVSTSFFHMPCFKALKKRANQGGAGRDRVGKTTGSALWKTSGISRRKKKNGRKIKCEPTCVILNSVKKVGNPFFVRGDHKPKTDESINTSYSFSFSLFFYFYIFTQIKIHKLKMVASRPGSPYTGGRPSSSNSVHTKVEEDLHEFAGIDYDKVI